MITRRDFFATHGRGTFEFVKQELLLLNSHSDSIQIKEGIEGKILFNTDLAIETFFSLKTVERVFLSLLFLKFDATPLEPHEVQDMVEEAFKSKSSIFLSSCFATILNKPLCNQSASKKLSIEKKFRVNCKFTGKWNFNKKLFDFKQTLIDSIIKYIKSIDSHFEIDSNGPDFEIILHLTDAALSMGIPISSKPLSNRTYIQHVGLRSTICSMMLQACNDLVEPRYILDPFGGKATILTEYLANNLNNGFFISSDEDSAQLDCAQENLRHLQSLNQIKNLQSNLILTNFTNNEKSCLPYRDHMFDLIVTDLPFGLTHTIKGFEIAQFYRSILIEFDRLLDKSIGILVVLVNADHFEIVNNIYQTLDSNKQISLKTNSQPKKLSLGKTNACLIKFTR